MGVPPKFFDGFDDQTARRLQRMLKWFEATHEAVWKPPNDPGARPYGNPRQTLRIENPVKTDAGLFSAKVLKLDIAALLWTDGSDCWILTTDTGEDAEKWIADLRVEGSRVGSYDDAGDKRSLYVVEARRGKCRGTIKDDFIDTDETFIVENITPIDGLAPIGECTVQNIHEWNGDAEATAQIRYDHTSGEWLPDMEDCPAEAS